MKTISPQIRPTNKQYEAWLLLDENNKSVKNLGFGGGAGGGKTWLACEWLITLCYKYPYLRAFIAREELTRLKKSTFITFKKVCRYHKIPDSDWSLDSQNSVIKFKNGSVIDLIDVAFKPSDPDYERFGSLEYTVGFGEEAGEWTFDAFDILKSRVGRHNHYNSIDNMMCEKPIDFDANPQKYPHIIELPPKLLLTFNPSRGWLYRVFYLPWKEGRLEKGYAFIQTLYTDNPYTAKMYGEQLDGIKNKVNKARLKEGDWEYSDDIHAMTTLEFMSDMFSNTITLDGNKYMSIDVAGKGTEDEQGNVSKNDSTVFTIWEGLQVKRIVKTVHQSIPTTVQYAKDLAAEEKIPYSHIVVDANGIGSGVAGGLNGCVAWNSNSSPFLTRAEIRDRKKRVNDSILPNVRTQYANLKTQAAFKLAELINEHKISTVNVGEYRDEIIEDLTSTLQERDEEKEAKKKMITKEDIKAELGRSPDVGDTFLMRMYWELKADAEDKDPIKEGIVQKVQQTQFQRNQFRQVDNSAK